MTDRVLEVEGAAEHNLRDVDISFGPGLTAIVGVSGSGKSSLVFDTVYNEARRRFLETLALGSPWLRVPPADVRRITGFGPAVSIAQNVLNRNPSSTVASSTGMHPFFRILYARFADVACPRVSARSARSRRRSGSRRPSSSWPSTSARSTSRCPWCVASPGYTTDCSPARSSCLTAWSSTVDRVAPDEPRVAELVEFLQRQRGPFGLWEHPAHPQLSRWLTFDLDASLRRLGSGDWVGSGSTERVSLRAYPKRRRRY